ncbi:UPF0481 protein At3g47200-like [Pistacia vera]|uniref:UPF0481 protein At3g47200-like n=1 Tax=Pistacia vera TaxID=55513 RepID=UPI001262C962|nr:UPF0481 protein At3g47200-like [Pistacia vera]
MNSSIDGEVREERHLIVNMLIHNWEASQNRHIDCCIYRVPTRIRKVNEETYTPQAISIGPFHHQKTELGIMENLKEGYVDHFFSRTTLEKREKVLAFIQEHELKIRDCYSEPCTLNNDDYVTMILRDAIFIIEVFLSNYEQDDEQDSVPEIKPTEKLALMLDFILLENQLPYFLLEGLYKIVVSRPPFINLCCDFFRRPNEMFDSVPDQSEIKHFTDLLRVALVKSYPQQKSKKQSHEVNSDVDLPSAAKLHESGVKFSASQMECLFDIKFEEGELRIPQLSVDNATETILRNIMALEQCYYPYTTLVCDYVELLDSLIDEKSDLDLLVKEGIISNRMGNSTSIVRMVNNLCTQITINRVHYEDISKRLKKHYNEPCNHTCAKLKSVYFSDLWTGTATIAAAVLLILTFMQTVASFLQLK